jgi:pimeloyl-ACP methyl ester carboxylesterase
MGLGMKRPSVALLKALALARAIPFQSDRVPASGWVRASDGVKLHYLDWPGGPRTLVLLHGGALAAHTFDLLALALGDDVRCLALDLRGHGARGERVHTPRVRARARHLEPVAGEVAEEALGHLASRCGGGGRVKQRCRILRFYGPIHALRKRAARLKKSSDGRRRDHDPDNLSPIVQQRAARVARLDGYRDLEQTRFPS